MYEKLKEFKTRLESTRGSGAYWAMSPELQPALNNAPFTPLFHVKSDKIYIVSTLFWKQLSNREGYITFPGLEQFKVPAPVTRVLGIDTERFLVLFIGWCSLDPRIEQKDKTHRLSKAVFISREGLRFPIRERHEFFDKLLSIYPDDYYTTTQGHLIIRNRTIKIIDDLEKSEYALRTKSLLFFNHIIFCESKFLYLQKDNNIILGFYKPATIFSWDHPKEKTYLHAGAYVLHHPFPARGIGID